MERSECTVRISIIKACGTNNLVLGFGTCSYVECAMKNSASKLRDFTDEIASQIAGE